MLELRNILFLFSTMSAHQWLLYIPLHLDDRRENERSLKDDCRLLSAYRLRDDTWAVKCGLAIERSDIVDALAVLIEDGLAKAYLLSGTERFSTELQGMPPLDIVEEYFKTYFYITKKGTDLHISNRTWSPFDNEGELRPNWHLDPPNASG